MKANRKLIEAINESNNGEFLKSINDFVYSFVSATVEDISTMSPFIRPQNCVLQPVNEAFSGAVSSLSEYDFFLGIDNVQVEANTRKPRVMWKTIWREFRARWRLGRKKYKKTKNVIDAPTVEKYGIFDFRHDLMLHSLKFLSQTTVVTEFQNRLTFVGKDDFGSNINVNIFVCCYDAESGVFKLPKTNRNSFLKIDFGQRFENFNSKVERCGDVFVDVLKILNNIYVQKCNKVPNQILMESLVCCTPDKLFDKNDIYKTFLNVANYIRISAPSAFMSICDFEKQIFDEPLILKTSSQIDFRRLISALDEI